MSSKILEYADYVISNFDSSESEFSGAVNVAGDLKVVGTTDFTKVEIDTQGTGYLKFITGPNAGTDKYTFPSNAPSQVTGHDPDKRYYLSTVTSDSSGQLEWASFDESALSIANIAEIQDGIGQAYDGGILYVDGFDSGIPQIAMDRANSFKMIENQDGLPGHLVDNEDELLITANRLSSSKQLAKIKVADLIQSVQILATDIQVIGLGNNKVITSTGGVTVEVEDTDGNINRTVFDDDGLRVQGSLQAEELYLGTSLDTIGLIGSSYDTAPSSLGYSFVRGAHTLSTEYLNSQSISLFDDRLYIGSTSDDTYINFASNNYIEMNENNAYILNNGSIEVSAGVAINFANNFSCTVDTIFDQNLQQSAANVIFSDLFLKEDGLLVGDATESNPMVAVYLKEDQVSPGVFYPTIRSNQKLFIDSTGIQIGPDTEKLTLGVGGSTLNYNGNEFSLPGIKYDAGTTAVTLKENLDADSKNIINVNDITVDNQINAAEIRGVGSGSCEFYSLIATEEANLGNSALCHEFVGLDSAENASILLQGTGGAGGDQGTITLNPGNSTQIQLNGSTGVITNPTGSVTSSSISIKENVQSFTNGLEAVMNMKPVSYNRKKQPKENREIGFIAEEMEQFFPQVVRNNSGNDIKGISYQEIIPVLVSALQEQQKKIEKLESKISK